MEQLPAQMLPTVRHVIFWVFNLAIPNIIAWLGLIIIFFVAAWARLPKLFESES